MTDNLLTGDRVNWGDDQRADAPDLRATSTLVGEALLRTVGNLMGSASGLLTAPSSWNTGTLSAVTTANGFIAYDGGGASNPGNGHFGRALRYDPAQAWQPAMSLNLSAYSDPDTPVIWAKREEVATNNDARVFWESAQEKAKPHNTRVREYVAFAVTASYSLSPGAGYFPIARVTSWSGSVPTITPIMVWDGLTSGGIASLGTFVGSAVANVDSLVGTADGLVQLLWRIRRTLGYRWKMDGTGLWNEYPTGTERGLNDVDGDLAAVESCAQVLACAKIRWDGTAMVIDASRNITAVTGTAGSYGLTMPSTIGGKSWIAIAAHATTRELGISNVTAAIQVVTPQIQINAYSDTSGTFYAPNTGDEFFVSVHGILF